MFSHRLEAVDGILIFYHCLPFHFTLKAPSFHLNIRACSLVNFTCTKALSCYSALISFRATPENYYPSSPEMLPLTGLSAVHPRTYRPTLFMQANYLESRILQLLSKRKQIGQVCLNIYISTTSATRLNLVTGSLVCFLCNL